MTEIRSVEWVGGEDGHVRILDQTLLPGEETYIDISFLKSACEAIRTLKVRGAPLLGVFGLYALALGVRQLGNSTGAQKAMQDSARSIKATRPTAVNLSAEIDSSTRTAKNVEDVSMLVAMTIARGSAVAKSDAAASDMIGQHGQELIADGGLYLTHCNTGSLATAGIGTALGIFKTAHRAGKRFRVLVPESRPLLQGSRLTAWELEREGIPYKLCCESALGAIYSTMNVHATITGADRIARNGDTANKTGTLIHAILCERYGVPFYIAAPFSTFDTGCPNGEGVPIEHRGAHEVRRVKGILVAPAEANAVNPAFDVTPAELISGFVTEKGILQPPFGD
ncbi:MAG: S-methyl-5-thioribose-1-phosphate isomerase [Planctomycetota bacterium]|nr:S-methyl-5-thioribose-1-phosphate isomerase [Planctomycetota bacterium]